MITMLNPGRSRARRKHRRKRSRNTWFGQPRRHRLAALKGWRHRRRKYKSRKKRIPARSRKRKYTRRKRRSPSRAHRRKRKSRSVRAPGSQYWPAGIPKRAHKRRRKKGRSLRAVARLDLPRMNNPHKRRVKMRYRPRRRNTVYWIPPYGGSSNPYWVPSYAHNPNGAIGAVTRGFDFGVLKRTLPVAGGAIGNAWLTGMISRVLPGFLVSGPGNYVVGLASAGLLGAGVGAIAPRYAGPVFLGGIVETMTRIIRRYVMPTVSSMTGLGIFNLNEQSSALGRFDLTHQSPALGMFDLWEQSSSLGQGDAVATELSHQLNYPQGADLNHPTGYSNPVDEVAGMELAGS